MLSAILAALIGLVAGQSSVQPYAGTWTAEHNGTIFVRLTLQVTEGHLTGTLSVGGDVHVDPQGEVDRVTAAPQTATKIQDLTIKDGVLSFSRSNGGDVDRFEVRLTGEKTAELALVLDEDARRELASGGVPVPKPFRLTRAQ